MKNQVKNQRQEENKELRELINLIDCFTPTAQAYWINALVKQGKISECTAGRILVNNAVILRKQ